MLLGQLDREDGDSMFLRNVTICKLVRTRNIMGDNLHQQHRSAADVSH